MRDKKNSHNNRDYRKYSRDGARQMSESYGEDMRNNLSPSSQHSYSPRANDQPNFPDEKIDFGNNFSQRPPRLRNSFHDTQGPLNQNRVQRSAFNTQRNSNNSSRQHNFPQTPNYNDASQQPPAYDLVEATNPSVSNYDNTATNNTYMSGQPIFNRLSFVSSISSGFGDGLTNPEPTFISMEEGRPRRRSFQSQATTKQIMPGLQVRSRESTFSTSSIDTPPRFRTVNSWIEQQSVRVAPYDQNIPPVPPLPGYLSSYTASENNVKIPSTKAYSYAYNPDEKLANEHMSGYVG